MGLQENFQNEKIEQLDVRAPVTIRPDEQVRIGIKKMTDNGVGCVIVVDNDEKPIGIFTESMIVEMLAHQGIPMDEPIQQHMSERCPWVRASEPDRQSGRSNGNEQY